MPKIFTLIDSQMKAHYEGKRTEEIAPGLPPGIVQYAEKWVESKPIVLSGRTSSCFIRGKFDTVIRFDDRSYGVVDFKTSQTKSEHIPLYGRQLHAYAHCLENAAAGKFALSPVAKIGLLVFEPESYLQEASESAFLSGSLSWIEIPRDDHDFLRFLSDVVAVLDLPEPPAVNPSCEWCQYRNASRQSGL